MKERILIIDDEAQIAKMVGRKLTGAGFDCLLASNGKEGYELACKRKPNLVILDVMMPGIDGFEVCRKLRGSVQTSSLPIIMLTAMSCEPEVVHGLQQGADDYLTKPFVLSELMARVKALLIRAARDSGTNPLTGLPGNKCIHEEVHKCLADSGKFAFAYLDLDNFKGFNDTYGFSRGDDAIKLLAQIIIKTCGQSGKNGNFIGHIGGDDFFVITALDGVEAVCAETIKNFDEKVPSLYKKRDRDRGYITARDRQGQQTKFPIMTLSIGVTTNKDRKFVSARQVSEVAAQVKLRAKRTPKSNFCIDGRRG